MSKEERKVPELRFRGFHDDWEQRKFSEIFTKLKSYPLSRSVETSTQTDTKYIHYGDIHTGVADKIKNLSNIPYIENKNYETLQKGDIILADASEDHQGIATPTIIVENTNFNIVAGLHTIALRTNNATPLYLYYLIKSSSFRKHGYRTGTGMKVFGITANNVLKFETYYPSLEEQSKISKTLANIDQLITLHQRKIHILDEIYSSFIDKIYPNINQNSPNLRFKHYYKDWKATKLEMILEEFTYKSKEENEFQMLSSTNSGMEIRNGRVSGTSNKGYKVIDIGDLVLSPQNLWLGNINVNNLTKGLVSPSYKTFHIDKVDGELLEPMLRTKRMLKTFENVSTQGASVVRRNLDMDLFNQIIVKLPEVKEKAEISRLHSSINNIKGNYERKICILNTIKKEFLRKMFL